MKIRKKRLTARKAKRKRKLTCHTDLVKGWHETYRLDCESRDRNALPFDIWAILEADNSDDPERRRVCGAFIKDYRDALVREAAAETARAAIAAKHPIATTSLQTREPPLGTVTVDGVRSDEVGPTDPHRAPGVVLSL